MRRLLCISLLAGLFLAGGPLPAQAPRNAGAAEEVARRAIGQLRSPYCPGLMLEVCPSTPAEMLRDSLRMLAAEGRSAEQIVEWMIANHGEEWRAVPKRQGLGLWAWLAPPLVLLLGLAVVGVRLGVLRGKATEGQNASAGTPLSDAEQRELEAALHDWSAEEEVR